MKFKLSFVLLLLSCIAFAQQAPDGSIFTDGAAQVRVPQSPEAGTLGRYGSVPLNGSNGHMNYSVPFFDIAVDGNSWPIALSYDFGGLILEGKPSITGLGWSLNAHGAITREVRGLPDEHKYGYHSDLPLDAEGTTVQDLVYLYIDQGNIESWSYLTLQAFMDGRYDSEVDRYNVNAGGMNFAFKIGRNIVRDGNGRPTETEIIYLSKHTNKVVDVEWTATRNPQGDGDNFEIEAFSVLDAQGVKYHFSVQEKRVPSTGQDEIMIHSPITSWNLEYVEYLNGQRITFSYTPNTYYDYSFSAKGAATFAALGNAPNNQGPFFLAPTYNDGITRTEIHRQLLHKITFPKGSIDFSITTKSHPSRELIRSLYNKMTLKDKSGNPVNEFSFAYTGNRDYLETLKRNGENYYQFDYFDEREIPHFFETGEEESKTPYFQDRWKFYNGPSNATAAVNIPQSIHRANNDPSFPFARLGGLKRIVYPTKGATEIAYAQNEVSVPYDADDPGTGGDFGVGKTVYVEYDRNAGVNEGTRGRTITEAFTLEVPTLATIDHIIQGERYGNHVLLTISRTDNAAWFPVTHDGLTIPIFPGGVANYYDAAPYLRNQIQQYEFPFPYPPMYPSLSHEFGPDDGDPGVYTESFNSSGKILMMPGTYELKISTLIENTDLTAFIRVRLDGSGLSNDVPEYTNLPVGGLHVSTLTDCPDGDDDKCIKRQFSYTDETGRSSAFLYLVPENETVHSYTHVFPEPQPGIYYKEIHTYLSNPFTVADPSIGNPVFFRQIKETILPPASDGPYDPANPNSATGYVIRKYSIPFEDNTIKYPRHPMGKDLDKSMQVENEVYEQGATTPVASTVTNYQPVKSLVGQLGQDFNDAHPWSLKIHKRLDLTINTAYTYAVPPQNEIQENRIKNLHEVTKYREADSWDRTMSVTRKQDDLQTITSLRYNGQQQLIEESTIDSKGNTIKKEVFYPADFPGDPVADAMNAEGQNQVSSPMLIKNYYNNTLMGQTKIEYALNVNGYKPSITYNAKGDTALEPRLALSYNSKGQVVQVDQLVGKLTNSDDSEVLRSTAYIWGVDSEYLMAKVDNATLSQVLGIAYNKTVLNSLTASNAQRLAQLELIRKGLPNTLTTSYTYEPLIGVQSMLDPRGYKVSYRYDGLNRLKEVRDAEGNIVTDYDYHYIGEND